MRALVATHPSFMLHFTGERHPERPARLTAAMEGVAASSVDITEIEAPPVDQALLRKVHDPGYLDALETICLSGGGHLDMDTRVSPDSWEAALRSAGAVVEVIERQKSGFTGPGIALTRPPGHHALPDRAMGFCLLNNVALGAAAIRVGGGKVAILDWDVHHGNGTQAMVGHDPDVLYVSLHQAPFYPYGGDLEDIDLPGTDHTIVNIPLPSGTAGDVYRTAWTELVLPVLARFEPDWVLVSAGWDASEGDVLGEMRLVARDYGAMASALASSHPVDRTVLVMEGGYTLANIREGTRATLDGLAGMIDKGDEPDLDSPEIAHRALAVASDVIQDRWNL